MSAKTTKKQRRGDSHQGGDSAAASMAVNDEGDETTLAAILAEMKNHMSSVQNEMDDMRGRLLSRMEELENEVNDMKSRLSHMDELESKCQAQGEKIIALEARCGCLERSTQILRKENKWKYSAPSIPTSYWIEQGFDEEYVECMESLLEQLEDSTIEFPSDGGATDKLKGYSQGFEFHPE